MGNSNAGTKYMIQFSSTTLHLRSKTHEVAHTGSILSQRSCYRESINHVYWMLHSLVSSCGGCRLEEQPHTKNDPTREPPKRIRLPLTLTLTYPHSLTMSHVNVKLCEDLEKILRAINPGQFLKVLRVHNP